MTGTRSPRRRAAGSRMAWSWLFRHRLATVAVLSAAILAPVAAAAPAATAALEPGAAPAGTQAAAVTPSAATSSLFDVTLGADGSCSPAYLCTGETGYDGPTGWSAPDSIAAFVDIWDCNDGVNQDWTLP
jgi:hypothetical protein